MYLVLAILLLAYGGFTAFREYDKNQTAFIIGVVGLCLGGAMLLVYLILFLVSKAQKKAMTPEIAATKGPDILETIPEEKEEEPEIVFPAPKEERETPKPASADREPVYRPGRSVYERTEYGSCYVSLVGRGPILEVDGNRIRDMRNGRYYRIESNRIYSESGLVYEIYGNRIRTISGNQLYEKSGDTINKVFDGYFASISGNRLAKYDNSVILEFSGRLSDYQILLIAVLAFGE